MAKKQGVLKQIRLMKNIRFFSKQRIATMPFDFWNAEKNSLNYN